MSREEIFLVYDKNHFGIFTNYNLAFRNSLSLKYVLESYSSPALMYYRILELYKKYPHWERKFIDVNVIVTMGCAEEEEDKSNVEYVRSDCSGMGRYPFIGTNLFAEGNWNGFIKC